MKTEDETSEERTHRLTVEDAHNGTSTTTARILPGVSDLTLGETRIDLGLTGYILTMKATVILGMKDGYDCAISMHPEGNQSQRTEQLRMQRVRRQRNIQSNTTLRFARGCPEEATVAICVEDVNATGLVLGRGEGVVPRLGAGVCQYTIVLKGPGKRRGLMVFAMMVRARLDEAGPVGEVRTYSCDEEPITVCQLPIVELDMNAEESGDEQEEGQTEESDDGAPSAALVYGYDSEASCSDQDMGEEKGQSGKEAPARKIEGCKPADGLKRRQDDDDSPSRAIRTSWGEGRWRQAGIAL
eukprot:GHVU01200799.1.p1 GENE.GHVU01200799.1~~GHVU01200799.1.p1  ORF type:complete len:319 (+),score=50.39 GHVU01200799.1:61-957(+)